MNSQAIYHGDYENIGVTIHEVEEQLDTGDIVYQERLKIKTEMRIHQLRYHTTLMATDLVIKATRDYLNGSFKPYKQSQIGRYYSFMPLDLKKYCQKKFNRYCEDIGGKK